MTIFPFERWPTVGVCLVAAPWHWSLGYVTIRSRGLILRALCFGPVEFQHWGAKAKASPKPPPAHSPLGVSSA